MPVRHLLAVALALGLTVAACSGSAPSPSSSAADEIAVTLTDALRMEPANVTVTAGAPVRFVVTNTGATDHEFYLGDEAAQTAHAQEMLGMAGMGHDDPAGIGLKPGETKTLEYTFGTPGAYLAGCHVNAHYAAGMKATVTVTN